MTDVVGTSGAVVCEQQRASDAGATLFAQGGSAADAIIATILCVGVLAPYHSDIGGGGFAVIRDAQGKHQVLNFRHKAPAAATNEFYREGAVSAYGGSAVAVPGQMRGLEALHKRYGRLPWAQVLQPAIDLARSEIEVQEELVDHINIDSELNDSPASNVPWMQNDPEFSEVFLDGGGCKRLGQTFSRPGLANTLETLAREGVDAFYEGRIAEAMVEAVQGRGGLLTLQDLKEYDVRWMKPLTLPYSGHTVITAPAPASGPAFLTGLGVLERLPDQPRGSSGEVHQVVQALRAAYGLRQELGDPDFVPGLAEKQAHWLSSAGLEERARAISQDADNGELVNTDGFKYDNGTSSMVAADESGLVISITTTIGMNWGSRIIVPEYGFLLNNQMEDFSVEGKPNSWGVAPQITNFIKGGKRPLSSNCPYIVVEGDGRPVLAGGAAGGPTIISGNVQVTRNVLHHKMSAAEALAATRIHNQLIPDFTRLEPASSTRGRAIHGSTQQQASELTDHGHKIKWFKEKNYTEACAMGFFYAAGKVSWDPQGEPRRENSGGAVHRA